MGTEERCGNDGDRFLLRSYSRLDSSCAEVLEVDSVAELAQALIDARDAGRRVTFRCRGMSLDDQSLGNDLVISLKKLKHVGAVDEANQTITVGPGATWGDIVEATLKKDLVPYVVVSSKRCSAGGTLASDGLSRHSPSYGTESGFIASFEFLAVGDTTPRTVTKPTGSSDQSANAKLFRAVVGGFGYLGVVTEITYQLLSVKNVTGPEQKLSVSTELWTLNSFDELMQKQLDLLADFAWHTQDIEDWPFRTEANAQDEPAIYAIAMRHKDRGRGAVYRSVYSRDEGTPYVVFRPDSVIRSVLGEIAEWQWATPITRPILWAVLKFADWRRKVYVNKAEDFLFFMEGEVKKKDDDEDPPHELKYLIQQTFVVPLGQTAAFLRTLVSLFDVHDVEPTLLDILFLPMDSVVMSASHDKAGFAVTLAFNDLKTKDVQNRVKDMLRAASKRLWDDHAGRVHFTKNVYADKDTLRNMYGGQATIFNAMKATLDPQGVLKNDFFERVFDL